MRTLGFTWTPLLCLKHQSSVTDEDVQLSKTCLMDSRCACSSTSVRAEIVDNAWVVPQEPVRPGGSLEPVSCSAHMPSKHMFGLPQQPVKPGGGHLPAHPVLFSDSQTCLAVSPGSRTCELLGRPLLWGTKQLVTYLLNWLLKSVVSFSNMPAGLLSRDLLPRLLQHWAPKTSAEQLVRAASLASFVVVGGAALAVAVASRQFNFHSALASSFSRF